MLFSGVGIWFQSDQKYHIKFFTKLLFKYDSAVFNHDFGYVPKYA